MSSPPSPVKYPRPCIAELLRTRYYPPSLTFRVERIIEEACGLDQNHTHTQQPDKTRNLVGYRLLLSDGELMINATAKHVLHRLIRNNSVELGSLIEITKFGLRKAKRLNGNGNVLYLRIEDFQLLPDQGIEGYRIENNKAHGPTVGKRRRISPYPSDRSQKMTYQSSLEEESFSSAGLDDALLSVTARKEEETQTQIAVGRRSEDYTPTKRRKIASPSNERSIAGPYRGQGSPDPRICDRYERTTAEIEDDEDSDGFETATLDPALVSQRRQVLTQASRKIQLPAAHSYSRQTSQSTSREASPQQPEDEYILRPRLKFPNGMHHSQDHVDKNTDSQIGPLAKTEHTPTLASFPVHTLLSLLKPVPPLPQKTYRCTIFGLVTWVSPSVIKKPGFPLKRHIKIHDQTIGKRYSGVSISIFRDAQNFVPKVGTIALFRGLTAQWWEKEVILNAYERDCREEGWVIWDEGLLDASGYDVHGLRTWWEKRNQHHAGR